MTLAHFNVLEGYAVAHQIRQKAELAGLRKDRQQGHTREQGAGIEGNLSKTQAPEVRRGEDCIGWACIALASTKARHPD